MNQPLLFTPGPLKVSKRVLNAAKCGNILHRGEQFTELLTNLQEKLLRAFEVDNEYAVCLFTSTGRGVNEAIIAPFARHKQLAIVTNGAWGDNLIQIAQIHNPAIHTLECPKDRRIDPAQIEKFLKKYPKINTLAIIHQETRSGILNPLEDIAEVARSRGVSLIVDAISSVIAEKTNFQKLGISFFTCSSTKGLRSLPGLGIICGRRNEFDRLKNFPPPSHYFDAYAEYNSQINQKQVRFAQSTPLFSALYEAVSELLEEGVECRRNAIHSRTNDFRQWTKRNGIVIGGTTSEFGNVITNFELPADMKYSAFADKLKKRGIFPFHADPARDDQFQISFFGEFSDTEVRFLKKNILEVLR